MERKGLFQQAEISFKKKKKVKKKSKSFWITFLTFDF